MQNLDDQVLEREGILVRVINPADLEAIVAIDAKNAGRRREGYLSRKLEDCLKQGNIVISLVAEVENRTVGFIIAELYYGEFGQADQSLSISTLGVHPGYARRGIASALMRQVLAHARALHVGRVETLVDWERHFDLLTFFRKEGFKPGSRLHLCMELD